MTAARFETTVYDHIRSGGVGFFETPRGLIAVWGKEAVQFLDGMITNDMKTLEDGQQMLAAFPNAQGRLLAVVRILRQGDRFLIETEEATHEKVFQNLFRFTFAGDFFIEDLSESHKYLEVFAPDGSAAYREAAIELHGRGGTLGLFVEKEKSEGLLAELDDAVRISPELYETLRIEAGIPKYGVDMDENTIVPELGLDGMISYTKGCYIGQEIIARIHFRGHVAKQLTGLVSEPGAVATGLLPDAELTTEEGKNAGRVTSVTYSPKLGAAIALAFVRYDHLQGGTKLHSGSSDLKVVELPFL